MCLAVTIRHHLTFPLHQNFFSAPVPPCPLLQKIPAVPFRGPFSPRTKNSSFCSAVVFPSQPRNGKVALGDSWTGPDFSGPDGTRNEVPSSPCVSFPPQPHFLGQNQQESLSPAATTSAPEGRSLPDRWDQSLDVRGPVQNEDVGPCWTILKHSEVTER